MGKASQLEFPRTRLADVAENHYCAGHESI